ncbi:MAG: nucleotidyltransferase domain-containing protein [Methanobacteriaceae archaeon]|nr:nucleotidyltransferase domain-containing protein [Methanobacteriaceae archaeon]
MKIIKEKYQPEKILIFGSRARGDHLLESDMDIIIVSSKFQGIDWIKRIREVSDLWEGLVLLEPLCYTPQEFEEKRKQIGIVNQAVKEGVEV